MATQDERAEALEEIETVAATDEDDFHEDDLLAWDPEGTQTHRYVGNATWEQREPSEEELQ